MSKPTEARGAAKVAVLMTSLSNLVVIRVVVLKVLPLQFARHTSAFSRVADQREVQLDDADGVRPVASVFDGLTRRADLGVDISDETRP
jgi:hypothetical protein